MIKVGDLVSRNSYNNDILFKVIDVNGENCSLKGVEVRLIADSLLKDLKKENERKLNTEIDDTSLNFKLDRDDYFYLPAKILHIDSDNDYLNRCLKFYKKAGLLACGINVKEKNITENIQKYLKDINPDIVVITGHDAYYKKKIGEKCYKNSEYFIEAVKMSRNYEKNYDKLVIIAGACQSNYDALIRAGANFASSPKRINIHALDPAIIATFISVTEKGKEINLIKLLSKTKYGKDGIGGLKTNGMMYVGYPRNGE